ncbi:hypothetical protein HLK66_26160 (plasmid) [Niallia circulans]|uniref:hypothetical protein n=1 Tax=Niallia circulans TaxID=1397 RepID=UPI00148F965E|nr:hypothetical protein [Niallia circulans]QJX65165.1 hypothetical protein HLK66_26160 [Niallia circulans]
MKDAIQYLPVIIALLAGVLGYITGNRSNKINRFFNQVDDNLKEVCGPLYYLLEKILDTDDPEEKERKIDYLFFNYVSEKNKLFMLGNKFIIKYIFSAEKKYNKYKKSRSQEDWEDFWHEFKPLGIMIKNQYWNNFNSLYGEYRWFQKTLISNVFIRIWYEILFFLFQIGQTIINIMLIVTAYSIYDFYVLQKLPEGVIPVSLLILTISIGVYGLLMIIGSNIKVLRDSNDDGNFFIILIKKIFPKQFEKWENIFKYKKKSEVPNKYYRINKK